jgi:ornithine cyclodeaminase
MLHITDAMIDAALAPQQVQEALHQAFRSLGEGRAAMQERIRTEVGGTKISTMAAVLPEQGVAGAKVYTTLNGNFNFVILLFSTADGRPLASLDAQALTRLRTAACSVIASRYLARPDASRLALFGAGVQGRAHAVQMAQAYALREIRVCDPHVSAAAASGLQAQCGVPVRLCDAREALEEADIVVTASRATQPLFSGHALPEGCFVAAIGSSLPHTRELDDTALARSAVVAVEWERQALREAGDLVQAAPGVDISNKLVELADLVTGRRPGRRADSEITIYKSVGVAVEDVALAGLAWQCIAPRP